MSPGRDGTRAGIKENGGLFVRLGRTGGEWRIEQRLQGGVI